MLNRLISDLPFNPNLIEDLSFYGKRLRRENSVRRLGFVMIALSLLVQLFAAGIPPQKSLAESDNDVIRGGVNNKQQLLNAWDNPNTHVADIYRKFGVARQDIARLPNKPNATINANASNFWSVGRNPLSSYSYVGQQYQNKDVALQTAGPTVYIRPLSAWGPATYSAFRGTNTTTGQNFWILADCGNYVQNGPGQLPPPQLQIRKTIVGDRTFVKPGGIVKFRVEYRNMRQDSLAEDVKLVDNLARDKFNIISPQNLPIGPDNKMELPLGSLRYTDNPLIFDLTVEVKKTLKDGVQICNFARLTAANAPTVEGGGPPEACIKVYDKAPPTTPVTAATAAPIVAAPSNTPAPPKENGPQVPPSLSKSVKNITQNLSGKEAIGSEVQSGDVIEYELTTYNGRSVDIDNYAIRDFVGDILDYATIDRQFLADQDGTFNDKTKEVVWTNQKLIAGQDNIKRLRVRIKTHIPSTNKPSNTSTNFDCVISNEYGNEISMKLQCPMIKSVESLPNTGPGSAIMVGFGLVTLSGYFLARNSLVSKEIFIIRRNYAASGDK